MVDFQVLIADDERQIRDGLGDLVLSKRPNLDENLLHKVANPAQAQIFFNENRDRGTSLCIFCDQFMDEPDYMGTTVDEPRRLDFKDILKNKFQDLVDMAKKWTEETGNKVFIVRHSAKDTDSTPLAEITQFQVNNFDNPFLMRKLENNRREYLQEIFNHCDRIFKLESPDS